MGFNCAEHKWQHLLNPCPICSYKYSADDIASETNQNDTQDEAELIASKILSKVRGIEILPDVRDDMYSREIKMIAEGYRAGKEPQLNLNRMLLSTNGSLKETVAALQEELKQSKRETQAAVHLCEQSRSEVEQLNKLLKLAMNERRYYYDLLEEEQAKALKIVEAANRVLDQRWTIDSAEQKTSLFNLLTEVRAYSTDSGDGGTSGT